MRLALRSADSQLLMTVKATIIDVTQSALMNLNAPRIGSAP
jgi:hypothetical protein